jgi:hypothetical protein
VNFGEDATEDEKAQLYGLWFAWLQTIPQKAKIGSGVLDDCSRKVGRLNG